MACVPAGTGCVGRGWPLAWWSRCSAEEQGYFTPCGRHHCGLGHARCPPRRRTVRTAWPTPAGPVAGTRSPGRVSASRRPVLFPGAWKARPQRCGRWRSCGSRPCPRGGPGLPRTFGVGLPVSSGGEQAGGRPPALHHAGPVLPEGGEQVGGGRYTDLPGRCPRLVVGGSPASVPASAPARGCAVSPGKASGSLCGRGGRRAVRWKPSSTQPTRGRSECRRTSPTRTAPPASPPIRADGASPRSPSAGATPWAAPPPSRLRSVPACCAAQSRVGWAVTPVMCRCRVACCRNASAYSVLPGAVSAGMEPTAMMPSAWLVSTRATSDGAARGRIDACGVGDPPDRGVHRAPVSPGPCLTAPCRDARGGATASA